MTGSQRQEAGCTFRVGIEVENEDMVMNENIGISITKKGSVCPNLQNRAKVIKSVLE